MCNDHEKSQQLSSWLFLLTMALSWTTGCSRLPSAPELPHVSAEDAGTQAVLLYDEDKNGRIDLEEAMKFASLRAAWRLIDKNEDQVVTSEEIAAHVRSWQNSPSYIVDARSTFYMNGEPLAGATITLEPAEFLGTNYLSVSAVTNAQGKVHFSMDDPKYPGIYPGVYRILVSKQQDGQELIPAKYNQETELGCEYSNQNWLACFRSYSIEVEQ